MDKILITVSDVSQEFSGKTLFSNLSFAINEGDKIALIGPNGVGKSSLLKIIAGIYEPALGSIKKDKDIKISYLEQNTRFEEETAYDVLFNELKKEGELQFNAENLVKKMLTQGNFSVDTKVQTLSGGQKKRLALIKTMISKPDVVLLDEPTNHLDFESIDFLETYLKSPNTTWVLTTHDRKLLEKCAKRIIEIDSCYKGNYFIINDSYDKFLEQKELYIKSVENKKDALKSVLRKENDWLSRMPKARGTKAKFRVENTYALQDELKDTEKLLSKKTLSFEIQSSDRKTKELLKIKDLSFAFGEKQIVKNFSCIIKPKDTIGILGNNGIGKSTLLKLIYGNIEGYQGKILPAQNLKIKIFSQMRDEIPLDWTLSKALSPESDSVVYHNQTFHIIPWAKKFLFNPAQLDKPLSSLSGGELARVYISRIITEEADFLILDEPTNDLDIDSIEVLEDAILEFTGAVLLVSHDRKLLENLCNFCIGFVDDKGTILPFADYEQWINFLKRKSKEEKQENQAKNIKEKDSLNANGEVKEKKKLTFTEKKELEGMEDKILEKEDNLKSLQSLLNDESVTSNHEKLMETLSKIEVAQSEVNALYARWEELESKR